MNVLFADAHIVVVEKPGGLLAVPGRGPEKQDCVVNRVRRIFPDMILQPSVHRLDMFTSGLMVLAKTAKAHRNLSIQFEKRQPEKIYVALLDGIIKGTKGRIELKFRLDVENRPYQIYDPKNGKLGITFWKKLSEEHGCTRVQFSPFTGRTHQLRLHAAHELGLGTPIVGDSLYGRGREGEQMMLHAVSLSIRHPQTNNVIRFTSQTPF